MTDVQRVASDNDNINALVIKTGLTAEHAIMVLDKFREYRMIAAEWQTKAEEIVVTDASQILQIQDAEKGFKIVQRMRIDAENTRKTLKERALNEGRFIDGVANELKELIAPIEEHLKAQKDFVKIKEEREAEERRIKAEAHLREQEEKEAAETEKVRLEQEAAARKERERIRKENEQLRKEAEEREAAMKAEREKAEKERIAAEEKARKEREEIERKAREERDRQDKLYAEERAKAQAEREAAEEEITQLQEKLENTIKCPSCGYVFSVTKQMLDITE